MPKIIIREIDNTKASTGEYSNFSVVVPGVIGTGEGGSFASVCDENYIYECSSQADFLKYVGKVAAISYPSTTPTTTQNGNQIAYELLGMGYTVLFKAIAVANDSGADPTVIGTTAFWECLKDRSTYDFRYICTGDYKSSVENKTTTNAYKHIIDVATGRSVSVNDGTENGRGDCCALIDVDETSFSTTTGTNTTKIQNYVNGLQVGGADILNKYAAIFAPKVTYSGIDTSDASIYKNATFPASFHFLACAAYARNVKNFAEWYAVAGYNRGVSTKEIASTSMKLGEIEINALQPRKSTYVDPVSPATIGTGTKYSVNLITNIRKNYYLWGSRTAHKLDNKGLVASHFLNIRDLCSSLKKVVWNACKELTFDPNSDLLWANFQNKIRPTLEKMKSDQGIKDYKIIKVKVTEKALLTAKIRIVPIEPVEDFEISIYLEDSIAGVTTEE